MWGSPVEKERWRRIRVAAAAYAYEYDDDPIMTDDAYDLLSLHIDASIKTGREKLDKFFAEEFDPSTGSWIGSHPELHRVKSHLAALRELMKKHSIEMMTYNPETHGP